MRRYDPAVSPDAESWLALDESERVDLIRAFRKRRKITLPNLEAHAATHAIVENQLAEGLPSAVNLLSRLSAAGLDRHDAVHAIGCVLMEHIWNLSNKPPPEGDPNEAYFAALDAFTIESWRKLASGWFERAFALRHDPRRRAAVPGDPERPPPNKLLKLPAARRSCLLCPASRPWWSTTGSLVAAGQLVVC